MDRRGACFPEQVAVAERHAGAVVTIAPALHLFGAREHIADAMSHEKHGTEQIRYAMALIAFATEQIRFARDQIGFACSHRWNGTSHRIHAPPELKGSDGA
jgi:hypothetical protein